LANTIIKSSASENIWTKDEQMQALESARAAARPAPFIEDWRKTNPDLFPWDQLEEFDSKTSRREVQVTDADSKRSIGPKVLVDVMRDLMAIAGDDYDAKLLYYHKALNQTPAYIVAAKNSKPSPMEIIQKTSGSRVGFDTTLIVVESGAELTVYDRWEAPDENAAVIGRTEILLKPGARLNYIQEDQIHPTGSIYRRARVRMERDSVLNWTAMTPGAAWHAARLEIILNGPNSDANIYGLFIGTGANRADHRTHQYHGAPNAKSRLTFKTLLAGTSRSIYQGMITVPQIAQKTDAYQQCRNLMLDPGTHADAIPKLEIVADDVKCSHGASIGTLNAEQLFYLQSRGLNYREALTAVAAGFGEEIIQHVPLESVQASWREQVSRTIKQVSAGN
jgi:FeS assembly protein SufD